MKLVSTMSLWLIVIFLATLSPARGEVEWNIDNTLKLGAIPLDMTVSEDGKMIFVLTHSGEVRIYSSRGGLLDTIHVGSHVDQIRTGPREGTLLLGSRENNMVEVLSFEFIREINISGSPIKGDPDAPVAIVVFSEFQ